jgi:hypothetical protein
MSGPSNDLQFALSEGFNYENLLLIICYPCFVPMISQQTVGLDLVLSEGKLLSSFPNALFIGIQKSLGSFWLLKMC